MQIDAIKEYSGYFLVNETISVPKSNNNRHYKFIQEWLQDPNNAALVEAAEEIEVVEE